MKVKTSLETKVSDSLIDNPVLELVAKNQIHHLYESAELATMKERLHKLDGVVTGLAAKHGIVMPPKEESKPIVSLSQKVINSINKTASCILDYFKTYFVATAIDDSLELSDEDMQAMDVSPPASSEPKDILKSIRSYAAAPNTEASYFTAVKLDANPIMQSAHNFSLEKVLQLAIKEDTSDALLQLMTEIDLKAITKVSQLKSNEKAKSLADLMDLYHSIIFSYKLSLPESLLGIGLESDSELEALRKLFDKYLEKPSLSAGEKLSSLLEHTDKSDGKKPNIGFSSTLMHWTFLKSIEQIKKSPDKSINKLQQILESNMNILLKLKQEVKSSASKPLFNSALENKAKEALNQFFEREDCFDLINQLTNQDLYGYIKERRLQMILGKLDDLKNSVDDDNLDVDSYKEHQHGRDEFFNIEGVKEQKLRNALPYIYTLLTFEKGKFARLNQGYEDSYDSTRKGLEKRKEATLILQKVIRNENVDQKILNNALPLILSLLSYDLVIGDAKTAKRAEEQLTKLVKNYEVHLQS